MHLPHAASIWDMYNVQKLILQTPLTLSKLTQTYLVSQQFTIICIDLGSLKDSCLRWIVYVKSSIVNVRWESFENLPGQNIQMFLHVHVGPVSTESLTSYFFSLSPRSLYLSLFVSFKRFILLFKLRVYMHVSGGVRTWVQVLKETQRHQVPGSQRCRLSWAA